MTENAWPNGDDRRSVARRFSVRRFSVWSLAPDTISYTPLRIA